MQLGDKKMKKVLFLIPTLGHGGAERVLVNLANGLDKKKYDVTIQTLFDVGIYQKEISLDVKYIPGLKHYFSGNTKVMSLFAPKTLNKFYIKEEYDLIVSYLEGSAARIVSGCTKKATKKIAWIHIEQETPQRAASSFRSIKEAQKCYSQFDRIVAVSKTVLEDFEKVLSVNCPKQVIYNVVETEKIRQLASETIEDIEYNPKEINICSVAKLMKTKGFDRMPEIISKLRKQGIPVHMYLLGKGEEEQTLRGLVRENNIENYWTFVGFKENPYKYVAQSDLYVCSSRREGFSTAVTESLIVGTPVLSTNCSGAKELLGENNEYGIVTENNKQDLYEGILKLLSENGLLLHYKEMAKERGKFFSTEARVADAERLFDEVLSE